MTEMQSVDQNKPLEKFLKDYQKPHFKIEHVFLTFELDDEKTKVYAQLDIVRTPEGKDQPLVLSGERLKLLSLFIDDQQLTESEFQQDEKTLTIPTNLQRFKLTSCVEINPLKNTYLDGLYKSKGIFCTQNEPEGFRKITYFLDRPDVMSSYKTKIVADKAQNPVLLSNGNKIEAGDLDNGRHYAIWEDPFKKPAYLFALVAGKLACIEDEYLRKSGKPVKLQIFCEEGCESKCTFAMESLKKSMKWDEKVFDLEYDLDIFMIVAVEAFNAGAMENKGLNIFNISCILADQESSTDDNFIRVEKVIAHEYFHNWTGDRVTLRDWFQLTLKEGLTVFRDQEFTSDMHSRPVHRIENVSILKTFQFPEDAGPTSHPIRPASYIEMNNFYTTTVYDKGSEIIRMVYTLLGKESFFKGMKKYFELFDGKAVTCDDFIYAMEQGSQKDLSQFKRWYEQKGTPRLNVDFEYDSTKKEFSLHFKQSNPKEGESAPPLLFPLKVGLFSPTGEEHAISQVIEIKEKEQTNTFKNIEQKPFVSLNRDFSAPVIINSPQGLDDWLFLMQYDTNDFNRWECCQEIAMSLMLQSIQTPNQTLDKRYIEAFQSIILDEKLDPSFKALALAIPSETLMAGRQKIIEIDSNFKARKELNTSLACALEPVFLEQYHKLKSDSPYQVNAKQMGQRSLKNTCLSYLGYTNNSKHNALFLKAYLEADNMTDAIAALAILNRIDCEEREKALSHFYNRWSNDVLVITKWLMLVGSCPIPGTLERVQKATQDKAFNYKIPNLVRALIGSFFENHVQFHAIDGSGYQFAKEQIEKIDQINPSVAARLSMSFKKYPKLDLQRQEKLKASLESLLQNKNLSRNAYEIISKSIAT